MMPVRELRIAYRQPARYDDLITIRTEVPEWPQSRFLFDYRLTNQADTLVATGRVELVFVNMGTMRPVRVPDFIQQALEKHQSS